MLKTIQIKAFSNSRGCKKSELNIQVVIRPGFEAKSIHFVRWPLNRFENEKFWSGEPDCRGEFFYRRTTRDDISRIEIRRYMTPNTAASEILYFWYPVANRNGQSCGVLLEAMKNELGIRPVKYFEVWNREQVFAFEYNFARSWAPHNSSLGSDCLFVGATRDLGVKRRTETFPEEVFTRK